jgi:hypothetical protein
VIFLDMHGARVEEAGMAEIDELPVGAGGTGDAGGAGDGG